MANRRVLVRLFNPPCVRSYTQSTSFPINDVPVLDTKNWGSEVLTPNYKAVGQKVISFSRATSPNERSKLGEEFLKGNANRLTRAANSILGCLSGLIYDRYWFQRSIVKPIGRAWDISSGTAFKVGHGVYFTHNHNDGRIRWIYGQAPVNQLGEELTLVMGSFNSYAYAVSLTAPTDRWSRDKLTTSRVMRKTLQQARRDGIWEPAPFLQYDIILKGKPNRKYRHWLYLDSHLDVGVLHVVPQHGHDFGRQTSELHNRGKDGTLFATLGFPTAEVYKEGVRGKTKTELREHFSYKLRQLSASVGQGRVYAKGRLFEKDQIEFIGVQNVMNRGHSGGPLICDQDVPGKYVGIASQIIISQHPDARGPVLAVYVSVDHPVVIASYLQFVLPSYASPESVPREIKDYLAEKRDFARWYVEVAWQRLADGDKTEALRKHWSRYGDLKQPKYVRISVPDKDDDWLGINQITSPTHIIREPAIIRAGGLTKWANMVWSRLRLRTETW